MTQAVFQFLPRKLGQSQEPLAELEKLHDQILNPGHPPDRRMLQPLDHLTSGQRTS